MLNPLHTGDMSITTLNVSANNIGDKGAAARGGDAEEQHHPGAP